MIDILYVGPYRQNDAWGYSAKSIAYSLLNIAPERTAIRPIWLGLGEGPARDIAMIEHLEARDIDVRSILIQHGLPNKVYYDGTFDMCVAIVNMDCHIPRSWADNLNTFDLILSPFPHGQQLLIESGVKSDKVKSLSYPPYLHITDTQKVPLGPRTGHLFYTYASNDIRSGTREVLMAFLSEFSIADNVILLMLTEPTEVDTIRELITSIKTGLGRFINERQYPQIGVINTNTDAVANYVTKTAQTFIDVGYNGVISRAMVRAAVYRNQIVGLDITDFESVNFPVKSERKTIFYASRPLPQLYTAHNKWHVPIVDSLHEQLRKASVVSRSQHSNVELDLDKPHRELCECLKI